MGSPEAGIDLRWLGRQCELLGEDQFIATLRRRLDEDSARTVLDLLARIAKSEP
jgi:hypothetical protein